MSKKIMVTESTMPPFAEYANEIAELWQSKWLTNNGAKTQELTQQLQDYLGIDHLSLVTNGHMALELALMALGVQDGEVITTPFTFASTTHAIVRNGLTPVFADIDPETFTLDPTKVEALITPQTRAIMPVHIYGNVCDVEAFERLGKKYHLKVIYDGAHSFGCQYKGKSLASYGDAVTYSFHATKLFNTIEGGAVVVRDDATKTRVEQMKNFGLADGVPVEVGINGKLNEFSAAMGICNLRHLDAAIAARQTRVRAYRKQLGAIPGVQVNPVQAAAEPNAAYFPVIFHDVDGRTRDRVFDRLAEEGINARKYFSPLTSDSPGIASRFTVQITPIAADYANRVLTLPLYPDLAISDLLRITAIIREVCGVKTQSVANG
ncbi:DegT/DnrJ/EryC1/StrS family aminotransferase [Levilactobacillus bambusae]|uniref:Aminotransferase n=1 Tax=Levilactobacillus bambusae TaxID=2024736 RepID=A0A2V1MZY7_9LACO|nr:DegT/DnrJ/EryC1/StrS family aminotransferase [Levilactobacillus bambusae]PWF99659.1 aminotransferase [Levilactobacillus bambusae]